MGEAIAAPQLFTICVARGVPRTRTRARTRGVAAKAAAVVDLHEASTVITTCHVGALRVGALAQRAKLGVEANGIEPLVVAPLRWTAQSVLHGNAIVLDSVATEATTRTVEPAVRATQGRRAGCEGFRRGGERRDLFGGAEVGAPAGTGRAQVPLVAGVALLPLVDRAVPAGVALGEIEQAGVVALESAFAPGADTAVEAVPVALFPAIDVDQAIATYGALGEVVDDLAALGVAVGAAEYAGAGVLEARGIAGVAFLVRAGIVETVTTRDVVVEAEETSGEATEDERCPYCERTPHRGDSSLPRRSPKPVASAVWFFHRLVAGV